MRCIESDSFSDAAKIYQEKIISSQDKFQKTYDEVSEYVEALMGQYRDQDITYNYLKSKLYGVEQVGVLGRDITYVIADADYLHECREIYASAEKAFNAKNYKAAIAFYGRVADADFENGDNAAVKYDQSVEFLELRL